MLDKKALRKFVDAGPAPAIPQNHDLLHAQQVGYIIRANIRIIGYRRTLVLYIYDRKQAAVGDKSPVWTMLQAGDDYTTLARKDDGSAHWRTALFERLGKDYRFTGRCAFCSAQDEQCLRDFFHDRDHDGVAALVRAQQAILDKRIRERQLRREKNTVRRMRAIRALPRGLAAWTRHEVMPAYFRCAHASVRKPVTGICTSCGQESVLPRASHGDKITCLRCKRELTVKSAGKMGKRSDQDTVQVIEKISDNEVLVRIMKVYYRYDRDSLIPETNIYENARIFIRTGPDGKATAAPYYVSHNKGVLTHWMPGKRPVPFPYGYHFEADVCGHVYPRNLPDALKDTPWEYCPVAQFYGYDRRPMEMPPFLEAHLSHPKLEHLVKTGFFRLASDLAYGRARKDVLDESQNRTHRILRVSAGEVAFLRERDISAEALSAFLECPESRDRQKLFLWRQEHAVRYDAEQVLEHVAPRRLMNYAGRQFELLSGRKDPYGQRYRNMQDIVSEYRDYPGICAELEYDMKDKSILCPADLQTAHDRVQQLVKVRRDAQMRRDFEAAMQAIGGHLDFETDGLKIVLPKKPEDLEAEGNALHHCVATYAGRVAAHECVIAFLRRCSAPARPFYTMEIRGGEIVQVRGMRNCAATPEVDAFMAQWEQQVLRAA